MIQADIHTHSYFSTDSKEPTENMIKAAINKGLKYYCITEHMDMDFPKQPGSPENEFLLDGDAYYKEFFQLKEKYAKIKPEFTLLFGVELGLQPHLADKHREFISKYPFDFIIGSEHTTNRKDPYYPEFYQGRSEKEAYMEYFEDIITNLNVFSDIDSLGHLDYVVRYGPNRNRNYTYSEYSDCIDTILRILINKNIALEVNSSGYKYELGEPNPSKDVIVRYRELGGELITIGSDAHDSSRISKDFDRIALLLSQCGFAHYCVYQNRQPVFLEL